MPYDAHSTPDLHPERLYNARKVAALLGVHKATIYYWMRGSGFPKPQKIGPRTVRWKGSQIAEYLDGMAAKSADAPRGELPLNLGDLLPPAT